MTAAPAPRSALIVRPINRTPGQDSEHSYVLATFADSLIRQHGGRFCNKQRVRDMAVAVFERSAIDVALFEDDPYVILGFVIWSQQRAVESVYLRLSLSKTRPAFEGAPPWANPERFPLPLANEVAAALLGQRRFIIMRRVPGDNWVWKTIHQLGFVPSIVPEAV